MPTDYSRLDWMARNYSMLVLIHRNWRLEHEERFKSQSIIRQTFTPDSGNVCVDVEYTVEKCKVTIFSHIDKPIRMYEEDTYSDKFQPSNISRIMKCWNGRNIVRRRYNEHYFDNSLVSTVLDKFVEILNDNQEMLMIKVEDMDPGTAQVSVKPFYEDSVRYIFILDGATIQTHYAPPPRSKPSSAFANVVAKVVRKTKPFESQPTLDFSDPSIDPVEAIKKLVLAMNL